MAEAHRTLRISDALRFTARTSKQAVLAVLLALTLVSGMALEGCAQSGSGNTGASSVSSPSSSLPASQLEATAEIADVATVAYLGPAGTYTEEAAKLFFGGNDELMACETVKDALAAVRQEGAVYAVIPQENTIGGPVADYVDALLDATGVAVVGEVVLSIRQTLMGLPGTDLSHVKAVYSHKQGLTQSVAWLGEHLPNADIVEKASTAAAAREVAEGGDSSVVAIAAPGAAELYGLEVLRDNVSMSDDNATRFYVVSSKQNELEGYNRVMLVASKAADELPGMLEQVCQNGTELVCLHDRPSGSALGTYRYAVELKRESGFTTGEIERLSAIAQVECRGCFSLVDSSSRTERDA